MTERQEHLLLILADPVHRKPHGVVGLTAKDQEAIGAALADLAAAREREGRLKWAVESLMPDVLRARDECTCLAGPEIGGLIAAVMAALAESADDAGEHETD